MSAVSDPTLLGKATEDQLRFFGRGFDGKVPTVVGTLPWDLKKSPPLNPGPPRRGRPLVNVPVTLRATVHRHDVRFEIKGLLKTLASREGKPDVNGGGHSTKVTRFSADSARRLRHFVRQSADLFDSAPTLTYPGNWDRVAGSGPEIKKHINRFAQWMRRLRFCGKCKNLRVCNQCHELARCSCCEKLRWASPLVQRSRCRHDWEATPCSCGHVGVVKTAYVWILEFQPRKDRPQTQREAPHFHFLIVGRIPTALLSRRWYEIVGSGERNHFSSGTRIEKALNPDGYGAYMGAYVSKLEQKGVPAGFRDVGRFWGGSRMIEKMVLEFSGTYAEVARRLRDERKANVGTRRKIAQEQADRAIEKHAEAKALIAEVAALRQPSLDPRPTQLAFTDEDLDAFLSDERSGPILVRLVTRGARPKVAGPRQKSYDASKGVAKEIYYSLPDDERRLVRRARKAWVSYKGCAFRAVSYARRWRWRGRGFVCLSGSPQFKATFARQAVMMDSGQGYTKYARCFCQGCGEGSWPKVVGQMRLAQPLHREFHPDIFREFVAPPKRPLRRACTLPAVGASLPERELCAFEMRLSCRCSICERAAPVVSDYLPPALRGQLLLDGKLAPDFRPEDFESGLTAATLESGAFG